MYNFKILMPMLTQMEKERVAELSEEISQTMKRMKLNIKAIEEIEKNNIKLECEMAKKKKEIKRIKNG